MTTTPLTPAPEGAEDRPAPITLPALLGEEAWAELARHMQVREFAEGQHIVVQGDLNPDFHIIQSGVGTVVAAAAHGERRELGTLRPGDCAGEMSLLTGEPASADVVAATALVAYSATQAQVQDMGDLRAQLVRALSTILAARLKSANERLLHRDKAKVVVICAEAGSLSALADLPRAIERVTGERLLLASLREELTDAASQMARGAHDASFRQLDPGDSLEAFLERASHDFDHIVLVDDARVHVGGDLEGAAVFHVGGPDRAREPCAHGSRCRAIVIDSGSRWTMPDLRRASERVGREVVAIVPQAGGSEPTERLARLLTRRRVGVAFGAGAAKGLAHLGVLRAFKEMNVPIDAVSGASIGSAVAAGVAYGTPLDELEELVNRVAGKVVRPAVPVHSLLSNSGIKDELRRATGEARIEDMNIPLAIVAVDLYRRAEVTFTSGLLWPRILASTAIPGVYPALGAMGSYLVDGGILTPVPARQCRESGADVVIGVRLTATRTSPRERLDSQPGRPLAVEAMIRSFEIMQNRISEISHEPSDVTIEVRVDGTGGLRDFKRGVEFATLGRDAVFASSEVLAEALPYVKEAAR